MLMSVSDTLGILVTAVGVEDTISLCAGGEEYTVDETGEYNVALPIQVKVSKIIMTR